MKCVGGVWLPDHEQHMAEWILKINTRVNGRLTYQYHKLSSAMKYVQRWRTAVDIGAHVGTWSTHLVKQFDRVVAFEPMPDHRACFMLNVSDHNKVTLMDCALGDRKTTVGFDTTCGSSGDTHVNGFGDVPMQMLDDFKIENVDFIKIDVEGYELFVVRGGEKTIRENKPTMVVEQKPKGYAERYGTSRMAAVDLLQKWGAKVKFEISGDFCLVW